MKRTAPSTEYSSCRDPSAPLVCAARSHRRAEFESLHRAPRPRRGPPLVTENVARSPLVAADVARSLGNVTLVAGDVARSPSNVACGAGHVARALCKAPLVTENVARSPLVAADVARSLSNLTFVAGDVVRSLSNLTFVFLLCAAWLSTACHPTLSSPPTASPTHAYGEGNSQEADPSGHGIAADSTGTNVEDDYGSESDAIGDDDDTTESEPDEATERQVTHPFDELSNAQLAEQLKAEPKLLGSASLGRPNSGRLFNAVQLPEDPIWKRVDPGHAWGTPETIEFLTKALRAVVERYPDTAAVSVGHLSAQHGGPLRPHVSHQSGRDVDLGFYYANEPERWYKRANQTNLDLPRTWWLIRTLVRETDIEMILLDRSLSQLVERYALDSGEPREWVEAIFHTRNGRPPIVRHASGHATHLHLRFFNPVAQKSGRRLMPLLVERKIVAPPQQMRTHVARTGDTLAKLASRYNTTMQAIRQANAMKTYQLVAGAAYRIPVPSRSANTAPAKTPTRLTPTRASNKPN